MVARKIAGEYLLVPIKNRVVDMQQLYSLNELGEYVWSSIDGEQNISQIVAKILEDFDITETEARKDLNDFLKDLIARNLIETI